MQFDTPGGEVHGVEQTGQLMRQLSANGIEIVGYVDGKALSGGMWMLACCDRIVCSGLTDLLGSVGIAKPLLIESKEKSTTIQWIKSAPAKAMGPVNKEMVSNAEQIVQDLASSFYSTVIAGFGLSEEIAAKVCNAEIFTAKLGVEYGIVDHICSLENVLNRTYANPTSQGNVPRVLAGDKPAQTAGAPAATSQEVFTMKPTGEQFAALVAANLNNHAIAAMITAQYQAGTDHETIKTMITEAKIKDAETAKSTALAAVATEQAEHAKTKADLAKMTADFNSLKTLAAGGQKDPKDGGSPENTGNTMKAEDFDKLPIAEQNKFLGAKGRVV
jgi:ClpP class serine protease